MKYAPLIWAALRRKPAEAILHLLAVTAAFTLFGLMVGLRATYQIVVDSARMDRILVNKRFPDTSPGGMPIALEGVLARFDGVTAVGAQRGVDAYYQDLRNPVSIVGVDKGMQNAWPELPLTPIQWHELQSTPTGVFISRRNATRLHVKAGDQLPLAPSFGGKKSLDLTVLGVMDDYPQWDYRFVLANFDYIDQRVPRDQQGLVWGFRLAVRDPSLATEIARHIDRYFANSTTPTRSAPMRIAAQTNANFGLPIQSITWMVGVAGLFVVLLLIGNAIAESVDERIGEFAVLSTIGFSNGAVRALVFAEALLPCLVGAVLGSALAPRLSALPRSLVPGGFGGLPPAMLWAEEWTYAAGFAVVLALMGSVAPLLRLRRLNVAAAIAGR